MRKLEPVVYFVKHENFGYRLIGMLTRHPYSPVNKNNIPRNIPIGGSIIFLHLSTCDWSMAFWVDP